jgi:N-acetylgalactosamine-N,N'-diacetylbacillosaminyl-diphospho-undecaprenol 4-alpha-N-acetylgalactosaminyltransferase
MNTVRRRVPIAVAPRPEQGLLTFLINSMEGGGAERAMANLLRHLGPHLDRFPVELVLLDDLPIAQNLPSWIPVHRLDGRGDMLRSLRLLARHWRNPAHRPATCVSYLTRANSLNAWLGRRFGHRAIISERVQTTSHIAASRLAPIKRRVIRATYPRAETVIAVSHGIATDLARNYGVQPERITVIGNPIDARDLREKARQAPSIPLPDTFLLAVGRLVPNKGFDLLLEAYARLPSAPPLIILGQGPERARLAMQARRLGLADRVTLAGYVDNPYPIMRRAHALVATSRAEGFPNTLIEAMCLACPVVATDCPTGPAEVLEALARQAPPWDEDAHGLLVPMEDVGALAAAMRDICEPARRGLFSTKAEKRAEKYGIDTVTDAYLGILFP